MTTPRSLLRVAWALHRVLTTATGGRVGTYAPTDRRVGVLFLRSIGRRTGKERRNGLYYIEDGPRLVVVASNAGAAHDPAWWSNLRAKPDTVVELGGSERPVRAREATPDERTRLWPELTRRYPAYADYQRTTSRPVPIVILEPLPGRPPAS